LVKDSDFEPLTSLAITSRPPRSSGFQDCNFPIKLKGAAPDLRNEEARYLSFFFRFQVGLLKTQQSKNMNASEQVERLIRDTADWRGEVLARIRKLMLSADAGIVEEWKWMGTPAYYKHGLICCMNPHKDKVKLTFDHGAAFQDSGKLFNASLEGNQRRAIDFFEGDRINERALKALLKEALAYDALKAKSSASKGKSTPRRSK
jgi:hypothetical protein